MSKTKETAADGWDYAKPVAVSKTAQRLLNLLFLFNSTLKPLSTSRVVEDEDLGYGAANRESDERKFRRDRETLEQLGIYIVEYKHEGSAENIESLWVLDRDATFAAGGLISDDDSYLLINAIDTELKRPGSPLHVPLTGVRDKIIQIVNAAADNTEVEISQVEEAAWSAFALHKALVFSYVDGKGSESKRSVCIYGMFENNGCSYLTGLDSLSDQLRTFKLSRITSINGIGKAYTPPRDFRVDDYRFLPFDFGGENTSVSFSFPVGIDHNELLNLVHNRGELSKSDDGWRWDIEVSDVEAAADFALSHASMGMRPLGPRQLLDSWNTAINEAVKNHG